MRYQQRSPQKQKGVALLVVMLLLAVMVVVATGLNERFRMDLQRTSNLVFYEQAKQYALGGEAYVPLLLKKSLKDKKTVNLGQDWAQELDMPDNPGAEVGLPPAHPDQDKDEFDGKPYKRKKIMRGARTQIIDLSNCLNLNALTAAPGATYQKSDDKDGGKDKESKDSQNSGVVARKVFIQLLENQGVGSTRAKVIAASTEDWIDSDQIPRTNGAEDEYYSALAVPYLAGNTQMADKYELRAIKGMTAKLYQRIVGQICALPEQSFKLNVNTIKKEQFPLLLAVLGWGPDRLKQLADVIKNRPEDGWKTVQEFLQKVGSGGDSSSEVSSSLDVTSNYFEARTQGFYSGASARIVSFYQRQDDKVTLIGRRIGGFE
ncbi:type II secretion system minor pseudopilin GspK [Dongshaea marina]|uniref:type II secretion system minor pseudopilin GspK n=1 Tax=Dongshaea marina TaxID=2047966 RepID=UPI000D3EA4C1|nr:type II secretion system minor pseudopilin GspK [Dongshaea marina]